MANDEAIQSESNLLGVIRTGTFLRTLENTEWYFPALSFFIKPLLLGQCHTIIGTFPFLYTIDRLA
jgi:hypothetical protein